MEECDFNSHVLGILIEECDFNSHVLRVLMVVIVSEMS